jgi:TonB family protein
VRISAVIFAFAILGTGVTASAQSVPAVPAAAQPDAAHPATPPDKDGIISDTQGVDFKPYIGQIHQIVLSSWKPMIPKEVEPPVYKTGAVKIRFKISPAGKLIDGSMMLEGRSGDTALDRAAWGAILNSVFPPLPAEFKGPHLEVRFVFQYNADRMPAPSRKLPKPFELPGPLGLTIGYSTKL